MSQLRKNVNLQSLLSKSQLGSASHAVTSSIIQVAAQVGSLEDGTMPADYESQIHLVLLKLRGIIAEVGGEVSDISKMTAYIVNYDSEDPVHERHFAKFVDGQRPAITIIPVTSLTTPGALIQIEVDIHRGIKTSPTRMVERPTLNAGKFYDPRIETVYDAIVVGAGLSGLAAARDITQAGLSCLVLEARDRVGGKTLSRAMEKSGAMVELGGAWINDTTETRMTALCKKYGAEMIVQNTEGNAVLQDLQGEPIVFPYGTQPQFDEETRKHLEDLSNAINEDTLKTDVWNPSSAHLDSINFHTYLRQKGASEIAVATCSTWTRAALGQEPRDISALYFLNYCRSFGSLLQLRSDEKHGGQHIRIAQGVQMISEGLASDLPPGTIRLSTQVYSVNTLSADLVEVGTPYGVVHARKVIISLPTPAYKTITFSPPLPRAKTVLARAAHFNYYTKVMLAFTHPFWIARGFCGLSQSFLGPACVTRDVSIPSQQKWVLACFLAGDNGRTWSLLPTAAERLDLLLAQVACIFADRETVDKCFIESVEYDWSQEQFAGWGCPCPAYGPGVLSTVGHALREVVGNVHFVGVETAGEFKGFMEGAVRSGERGAAEVVDALRGREGRVASGRGSRDVWKL